ncbi:hypothetical protein G9A89_000217, partial [Geosiphon pyriformis]
QATIDACVSELAFAVPDFHNHCWIKKKYIANLIKNKDLAVSWVKVKSYSGVSGNNRVDTLAGETAGSSLSLPAEVCECFLVAESTVISGNTRHFDTYRRYGLLIRGLPATKPRKELTDLRVWEAMDKTTIESLSIIQKTLSKPSDTMLAEPHQWKTSTNPNLNMAESENIGANHLGFVKSLFQQYSQQLGLNSNHYPAESAFNFYVNDRITECLGETVNIEATRENFYTKLFQHTNLPKNYSFAPIIREINQTIEKIQTPAATPKGIQLSSWKKHRVESPTALSYHYTPGSAINISSADTSTSNATLTNHYPVEKEEEKKSEDQEFTYQNPITENPEVETPNFQA